MAPIDIAVGGGLNEVPPGVAKLRGAGCLGQETSVTLANFIVTLASARN